MVLFYCFMAIFGPKKCLFIPFWMTDLFLSGTPFPGCQTRGKVPRKNLDLNAF
jgi:hypothetical protein